MSKRTKRVLLIAGVILGLILVVGIKFFIAVKDYPNEIAAIQIENIHLEEVADGNYTGECNTTIVKVKVQVEMKDHKITDIEILKHVNGQGSPAEAVIPEVIKAQSIQVDAISGATISSKVILKAIENAFDGLTE